MAVPVATSVIPGAEPITYTVEPWDFDGVYGITMNVTQLQFGGRYCPCVKVPYPADGLHNQQGADAIGKVVFRPGDKLMGFSLGVQVISLAMAQNKVPPFVSVILAGDTEARNATLLAQHAGIAPDTPNHVLAVVNEFDGWSDDPDLPGAPGYLAAWINAGLGTRRLHYYAKADPGNRANVVYTKANITYELIPTTTMPNGDESSRAGIATAYTRRGSTSTQRAAAAAQQVPYPNPAWVTKPEPAAVLPP